MAELFAKITAESAGSSPYEFNAVTVEADNTFAPSTDQAYAGSYSYKAAFGGTNNLASAYKGFTATGAAYLKLYMYVHPNTTFPYTGTVYLFNMGNDNTGYCYVRLVNGVFDRLYHWDDSGSAYTAISNGPTLTEGEWHCIELYYKAATSDGANDGISWFKFDGTSYGNKTDLDNDTRTINRINVGQIGGDVPASGSAIYFDEIEGYDAIPTGSTGGLLVGASALVGGGVLCGQGNLIN
jgi:hypothetical protein